MKKEYTIPTMDVVIIESQHIAAGSVTKPGTDNNKDSDSLHTNQMHINHACEWDL